MIRRALAVSLVLGALVASTEARAADSGRCGAAGRTWVAVHADATVGDDVGSRVVGELRAGLASQGIDVCDTEGESAPAARVSISLAEGVKNIAIRLALSDAVTAKDVTRVLDTSKIPPDGRALAIALATEELLRASWAEIAVAHAPLPPLPIPEPVTRMVEASIVRPAAPAPQPHDATVTKTPAPVSFGLGVSFAADYFSTGFARFGADARVIAEIGPRFGLGVRGGFRRSPSTSAPDGVVDADTLLFGIDASLALLARQSRFGVDLFARADLARVTFHAVPTGSAVATNLTLTSFEASGGVRARLSLTDAFQAFVEIGAGGPIVAARARDGALTVAGTDGFLLATTAGIAGVFR